MLIVWPSASPRTEQLLAGIAAEEGHPPAFLHVVPVVEAPFGNVDAAQIGKLRQRAGHQQ